MRKNPAVKFQLLISLTAFLFIFFFNSCRKTDQLSSKVDKPNAITESLEVPANSSSFVSRISQVLNKQNKKSRFLNRFEAQEGLPVWDKISVYLSNSGMRNRGAALTDTIVLVPLVLENTRVVSSFLVCEVQSDTVLIKLIRGRQYKLFSFSKKTDTITANAVASQLMYMQSQIFGDTTFIIKDSRLFNYEKAGVIIKPKHVTIRRAQQENTQNKMMSITYTQCYTNVYDGDQGQLVGVSPDGTNDYPSSETVCYPVTVWFDDGTGYGGGGGTTDSGTSTGGGGSTYTDPYGDPCARTANARLPPADDPCGGDLGWEPVPVDEPTIPSYDPNNPFANLDYPIDASDEPLIDNGINVSDVPLNAQQGTPRQIGKTDNRGNTEDMEFGTNGDPTGIWPSWLASATDDGLFNNMIGLFHSCTIFDGQLKDVGDLMIQKFKNKSGGIFQNTTLNQKVSQSNSFSNFLKRFGNELRDRLTASNGNIDNVQVINRGSDRPVFNGLYNKFHGLQILINDTEYTEIQLDNFELSGTGTWDADVTVTIHDHFGLDKHDALAYQGWHEGFPSWWLLQHTRSYVPFETVITVRKRISGVL